MFKFVLKLIILSVVLSTCLACQLLVPVELLSGCIFNRLVVTSTTSGITVNGQNCNAAVDKLDFIDQPNVYFGSANERNFYTIIMIDPDAPNHAPGQFYLHWIMSNVPGYSLKQGLGVAAGDTIVEYTGPAPPAFTGAHRYMFFAYLQTSNCVNLPVPVFRSRFDLMDWLRSFGGDTILRGPVGSISFMSTY